LGESETASLALSLVLKVKVYPTSRTLCRALVDRALRDSGAFPALCVFATQSLGTVRIAIACNTWMQSKSIEAFRLFLVLFGYGELREKWLTIQAFAPFLARTTDTGGILPSRGCRSSSGDWI
jgi:hypothetical protein